eukprot:scaffold123681_cov75-Phaeocystis_antarctica.AAC.1
MDIVVSVILAASTPVADPQLPSSPMKTQASCAERFLGGAFVNYADAVKSYDCARETLGCDLILGVALSSPRACSANSVRHTTRAHHARTPQRTQSLFQPSSVYLNYITCHFGVDRCDGHVANEHADPRATRARFWLRHWQLRRLAREQGWQGHDE